VAMATGKFRVAWFFGGGRNEADSKSRRYRIYGKSHELKLVYGNPCYITSLFLGDG